jgi:hypothetical protein
MTVAAILALIAAVVAPVIVFLTPLLIPAVQALVIGAVNGIASRVFRGRKKP